MVLFDLSVCMCKTSSKQSRTASPATTIKMSPRHPDPCYEEPCFPKARPDKQRPHFPKPLITVEGIPRAALNPGDFASLHQRTYDLRPEWFEGFQLNAFKTLAVHRIIRASWNLSHITPTGFRFGAQVQRKCSDSVLVGSAFCTCCILGYDLCCS